MSHSPETENFQFYDQEQENRQKNQISMSKELCIDTDIHLNHVSDIFRERLMQDNIEKALLRTFQRKKIVEEGQFEVQQAINKGIQISNNYVDKLERWLRDSIFYPKNLQTFWKFKQAKEKRALQKISSIQHNSSKLGEKLMYKTLEKEKKIYADQLERKKITIFHNHQFQLASKRVDLLEQKLSKILQRLK